MFTLELNDHHAPRGDRCGAESAADSFLDFKLTWFPAVHEVDADENGHCKVKKAVRDFRILHIKMRCTNFHPVDYK